MTSQVTGWRHPGASAECEVLGVQVIPWDAVTAKSGSEVLDQRRGAAEEDMDVRGERPRDGLDLRDREPTLCANQAAKSRAVPSSHSYRDYRAPHNTGPICLASAGQRCSCSHIPTEVFSPTIS